MRQGSIVSVHVARRPLPPAPGLVFRRSLLPIGGRRSGGFGAGLPPAATRVTLAVWDDLEACDAAAHAGWRAVLEACSTRGSFHGERPILATGAPTGDGPMAVITLGRASWRTLPRFLRRGAGLARPVRDAPGLIAAVSAGLPVTGNLTFSAWEGERRMLDFAYGPEAPHRAVVRDRPPILVEQLNARLRLLRVEGEPPGCVIGAERLAAAS